MATSATGISIRRVKRRFVIRAAPSKARFPRPVTDGWLDVVTLNTSGGIAGGDALEAFLTFNTIPGPLTIFSESRKLPPGHTLTWSQGATELEQFARTGPLEARHGVQIG